MFNEEALMYGAPLSDFYQCLSHLKWQDFSRIAGLYKLFRKKLEEFSTKKEHRRVCEERLSKNSLDGLENLLSRYYTANPIVKLAELTGGLYGQELTFTDHLLKLGFKHVDHS